MTVMINPGSGPVDGATYEDAKTNMDAFVADLNDSNLVSEAKVIEVRDHSPDNDGRYVGTIQVNGRSIEIEMPGLPLERVRYMGTPQNIWDFPRLYVDGSSWIWCFALGVCHPEEEPEAP